MQANTPPDITHLISAIADDAEAAAPPAYTLLTVTGDFSTDGVARLHSTALTDSGAQDIDVEFDALDRFEEMRRAFSSADQPLWDKATVTVTDTGEATVHFEY